MLHLQREKYFSLINFIFNIKNKKLKHHTVYTTQQLCQESPLYRLKRNSYYVTHELPYRILETYNPVAELRHGHHSVPKILKVTSFQDISQIHDLTNGIVRHLKIDETTCRHAFRKKTIILHRLDETYKLLAEQTLAQHEIGVRQIGQRLEEYLTRDIHVESVRIQLIELQHCQIRLQIVGVLSRLYLHILF